MCVIFVFIAMNSPSAASAAGAFSSFQMGKSSQALNANGQTYSFTVNGQDTAATTRCLEVRWNTKSDGSGTVPPGMITTALAVVYGLPTDLVSSTGVSAASGTNGLIRMTKSTGLSIQPGADRALTLANVRNGSTSGVGYYAILSTYSDTSCTNANLLMRSVTTFEFRDDTQVAVAVAPTFAFTVASRVTACSLQGASGYVAPASAASVDLGRLNATTLASGAHDLSVDTNAASGSAVYIRGAFTDHNLRSATAQPFNDSTATPVAGTATFSVTNSDTNSVNGSWKALSDVNAQVASSASLSLSGQCVGYTAAASAATPAGVYNATVIYTAVPRY